MNKDRIKELCPYIDEALNAATGERPAILYDKDLTVELRQHVVPIFNALQDLGVLTMQGQVDPDDPNDFPQFYSEAIIFRPNLEKYNQLRKNLDLSPYDMSLFKGLLPGGPITIRGSYITQGNEKLLISDPQVLLMIKLLEKLHKSKSRSGNIGISALANDLEVSEEELDKLVKKFTATVSRSSIVGIRIRTRNKRWIWIDLPE